MSTQRRFLHAVLPAARARVELDVDASRHAAVLRLALGDELVLFDGAGLEARGRIVAVGDRYEVEILERVEVPRPAARVSLILGMPKGSKLDDIVRSATEAGVHEIHLAHTRFAIAKPERDRADAKLVRLAKIAAEAARQSERGNVPRILAPERLEVVAARAPRTASRIVLSAREGAPWDTNLAFEVWAVVGPEGGLAKEEEAALVALGYRLAHVAVPILRVETAAPVVVAMLVDRIARSSTAFEEAGP